MMGTILKFLLIPLIPGFLWIAFRVFIAVFESVTLLTGSIYFLCALLLILLAVQFIDYLRS